MYIFRWVRIRVNSETQVYWCRSSMCWDIPGCADGIVLYLPWRDQCHCHLYPAPWEAEEVHHQVQQFPHILHRRDNISCSWPWL